MKFVACVMLLALTGMGTDTATYSENPEDILSVFTFFKGQVDPAKCSASFTPNDQGPLRSSKPTSSLVMQLGSHHIQKFFTREKPSFSARLIGGRR